ncbi:MAG: hypothetical protein OEV72_03230 [Thermoleophilia bacterium]|nr:hypothetical protein [Thermoleophilia bacterium]MDH5333642.1 hypothetical protein [Thermoleophilia bacterium]
MTSDLVAALDAVAYGDVFDSAVSEDELWRYSRVAVSRDELKRLLGGADARRALVVEGDLVAPADRPHLIGSRAAGIERAGRIERRARRVARVVRHVPFVRGVALTGSAAAGNAPEPADTDLLVIVAPGRLATVFVLLGTAARILGRQVLCPNYYLAGDHLAFRPGTYVARELAQAVPLVGAADLVSANPWLRDWFPNLPAARRPSRDAGPTVAQRALEPLLGGRLGDALERRAHRIAVARLRAHHRAAGEGVPPAVLDALADGRELRFHGSELRPATESRYEEAVARLASALDAGRDAGRPG